MNPRALYDRLWRDWAGFRCDVERDVAETLYLEDLDATRRLCVALNHGGRRDPYGVLLNSLYQAVTSIPEEL